MTSSPYNRPGKSRRQLAERYLHSETPVPSHDDLLEEVRQLRAAVAIYRTVVDRLLEKRDVN